MIISFNGTAGSGKSTVAKKLAKELNWPRYYIGGLRRKKAAEQGMSLAEYNKMGEKDPITDTEVDEYQKELAAQENNFIIEGRTSWYFIPHSLKIYLKANEEVAAKRIYEHLQEDNQRNEGNGLNSAAQVLKSIKERKQSDTRRYRKHYNIDVYDESHYDFILNTTNLSEDEAFAKVYQFVKNKLKIK